MCLMFVNSFYMFVDGEVGHPCCQSNSAVLELLVCILLVPSPLRNKEFNTMKSTATYCMLLTQCPSESRVVIVEWIVLEA